MSDNQNINGNDITNVDARADVGANEDILPHTNKDLFLEMTPKSTVKDAVGGTSLSLGLDNLSTVFRISDSFRIHSALFSSNSLVKSTTSAIFSLFSVRI